jgi:uncharacterized protein (DUF362 family)
MFEPEGFGIFQPAGPRPRISVAGGKDAYTNARTALSRLDLSPARGRRILLKPNAGRMAQPGEGVNTDPRVVAGTIDAFQEAGALVEVGESPITGVKALQALEMSGIAEVARARNCALLDLDAASFRVLEIPQGRMLRRLKVCEAVGHFDAVVSIPVMKVHMHTGVTLSVKNMKGCLWRRSKVELHMLPKKEGLEDRPLDRAIAEMAGVLRPHLAVLDGTVGMEGLGPSAGRPRPLGVVVAGADPFAADAVACRLMGIEAAKVAHLRLGAGSGYGRIDLADMDIEPEGWEAWAGKFEPAPENIALQFPGFTILDRQACSACQSTVLLFLRRYGQELLDYFPPGQPVPVALGRGHEDLPQGTLCIGNCVAPWRAKGIFVSGCPPVGSVILREVKKATGKKRHRHEKGGALDGSA